MFTTEGCDFEASDGSGTGSLALCYAESEPEMPSVVWLLRLREGPERSFLVSTSPGPIQMQVGSGTEPSSHEYFGR